MRAGVLLVLVLAACSSGPSVPPTSEPSHDVHDPSASCSPTGTALGIGALRSLYDRTCLAAPADQPLTIAFDNRDSAEPHNVAIFDRDPMESPDAKVLFRGEQFRGAKKVTYRVDALAAGEYHFHCDVHPAAMFGVLLVS